MIKSEKSKFEEMFQAFQYLPICIIVNDIKDRKNPVIINPYQINLDGDFNYSAPFYKPITRITND